MDSLPVSTTPDRHRQSLIRRYLRAARVASVFVALTGLLGIIGCCWNLDYLTGLVPGAPDLSLAISSALLLLGVGLLLVQYQKEQGGIRIAVRSLAVLALMFGFLPVMLEWVGGEVPGVPWLFREQAVAKELFFVGGAVLCLFFIDYERRSGQRPVQWVAIAMMTAALWTILRYIYISPDALQEHYAAIPLNTMASFFIFGIAVLFSRPQSGVMSIFSSSSVAGQMARGIVPVVILIIAAVGVATIVGLRSAGLYDSGIHNVIFTLSSIVIVTILIWRNAHTTDLTEQERQKAVQAAKRQREWQQVMLASIADAVIATDEKGRVQFLNPVAEKLTGFSGEEAVGLPAEEVFRLHDITTGEPLPSPVQQVLATGAIAGHAEFASLLTRYGAKIPVEDKAAPIVDSRVGTIGSVIVFRDVTERRRAEAMRSEAARQYASLAEAIPQIVWSSRADGEVEFFNQRWFDYTGLDLEGSRGRFWLSAFHEGDCPRATEEWQSSIASGRRFEVEARINRRDGSSRWHLIRALPVRDRDGRIDRWFGTCTDIDDQKRAEETMRFLADASTVLSASLEEAGTLQSVAELAVPKIADLCTVHLASGETLQLAAVSHMDPRKVEQMAEIERLFPHSPRQAKGIDNVIRTGLAELSPELDDGLLRTMAVDHQHYELLRELGIRSSMSVPLRGHRETLGVITFSSLESGRRFTPRDLTLAEEVARRTALALDNSRLLAEITETKEEAEDANAAKDQFLAVLSHELRTPLTPVLLAVEEIQHDALLPENARAVMAMTQRNIELEARLIDDLLDLTRIQRGKLELQKSVTDTHALLLSAIEICRGDIQNKELCISLNLCATRHHIDADPARLQQVFWNLIKNAVKFTEKGGSIEFRSRDEGEHLRIEVADSGIGVAPELVEKIFNAFEQGESSRTRQFGGLGLGLAITRNLVEAHGGAIWATSPGINQGTTFMIDLPPVDAAAVEKAVPVPLEKPASKLSLRILLVEDNPDTGALLKKILTRRGYTVNHAASMHEALDLAGDGSDYDLLLSDIGLPDGGGLELIQTLRHRGFNRPGIAMSGFGMEEDISRSREAGFSEHLTKPIGIGNLEETIQRLVATASV